MYSERSAYTIFTSSAYFIYFAKVLVTLLISAELPKMLKISSGSSTALFTFESSFLYAKTDCRISLKALEPFLPAIERLDIRFSICLSSILSILNDF